MTNRTELRNELRRIMDRFPGSSRSNVVRGELADTITACYVGNVIDRDEYQSLMAEVR